MRLYTDPRDKFPAKSSTRSLSVPTSSESGGGRALKTQPFSPANRSYALSGKKSYSRKSGSVFAWPRYQHRVSHDSENLSLNTTPEEMALLIQLRRAKLDMARAESDYLATLLESERGKQRSSTKSLKKVDKGRNTEIIDQEYDTCCSLAKTEQFSGHNSSDDNPFIVDGVLIDSDDEFLGNAYQKSQPTLTPLYVDPTFHQSRMARMKTRICRLFRGSAH
uniref:Uncharacterized protein n=1 Tax=Spongospora subterranea TaxID=70186 RepID=A0A0H5QK73_9EUKA|eukprot:CRZ02022.1 hypothetical protein [Spongospora subterranea]